MEATCIHERRGFQESESQAPDWMGFSRNSHDLSAFEDVDGSLTGVGENAWVLADLRPEEAVRTKVYTTAPISTAVAAKSARAPSDQCKFSRDMLEFVCKGDSIILFEHSKLLPWM